MKQYTVLVPSVGELRTHKDVIEATIRLVQLDPIDFVLVGCGPSASLCVDVNLTNDEKNKLPLAMVKSHLMVIRQEK